MDEKWNELIYSVTGGKADEMNAIKKFDIFDFFDYLENKSKKNG